MNDEEIKGAIVALKKHLSDALVRLGTLEAFIYMNGRKNPPPNLNDVFKVIKKEDK